MIRLVVWITLPSGDHIRCGEIVCSEPDRSGRIAGAFRYDAEWISHPYGFAIDPIGLPLSGTEYDCQNPQGIFPVFEDSLPDDWGRRLLIRKDGLNRGQQYLPYLLRALNGNALGALSYYPEAFEPPEQTSAPLLELDKLIQAAHDYEAGRQLSDPDLHLLFAAASSPGGARPKALVRTEDGRCWIAKFPSIKDDIAMVPIEAATLALARTAGLQVPEFKIEACGKQEALLVERFDLTRQGGRRHLISFQTLMQAEGYYTLGYMDLFEPLRRVSGKPAVDIPALYRQMVFNALIGNTDDHLKNFCMLHDDDGYCLSPAYDLLPDTADRREHVLHFNPVFHFPGLNKLKDLGRSARISGAADLVDHIRKTLSGWKNTFARWGVPDVDIKRLENSIQRRLNDESF